MSIPISYKNEVYCVHPKHNKHTQPHTINQHTMRFQLISDIHHEFLKGGIYAKIVPKCSTLVLAGDIGNPMQSSYGVFLRKVATEFEHIVLIHGNHEYYGTNYKDAVAKTREICAEIRVSGKGRVHFLQNSHIDINGVRFIGSTLWSKLDPDVPLIGDRNIGGFSIEWYNRLHRQCRDYLQIAIAESTLPTVVVSHHLPSFSLIAPKYLKYGMINQWFASDSDDLIMSGGFTKAWVYGHTHDPNVTDIGGVSMICNPVGYPGEREKQVSETEDDATVMVEIV